MIDRLEKVLEKYNKLKETISSPETLSNIELLTRLSIEESSLKLVAETFMTYKETKKQIEDTKELLKDNEMKQLAKEELDKLTKYEEELYDKLQILLLPKDENDGKNIIMEIKGAAGGDEANIFAGDLFRMYQKYAENQNWKMEIINAEDGTSGGFSNIEFIIKGKDVYSFLKYESGAHRVQRIPSTESNGRIHTSTATVMVMPEYTSSNIEIKESDIKIDVYRSGGAGGQSVNTTDSAVRMTHIKTGIVVTCQNERSQLQNKEKALELLKMKLESEERRKEEEKLGTERKSKIGTGDRSEKIRTYNYPQNRVTDHRINLTLNKLDRIMEGDINEIIQSLISEDAKRRLADNEN